MKNFIIQTIRGCGNLPYVGEHSGTLFLAMFIGIGCLTGAAHGLYGVMIGGLIMGAFMAPIYLLGAYERAKESDYLVAKETLHKESQNEHKRNSD